MRLSNAFSAAIVRCEFASNGLEGLRCSAGAIGLYSCVFDGNRQTSGEADLWFFNGGVARLKGCTFRNVRASSTPPGKPAALLWFTRAIHVMGCSFESQPPGSSIGIKLFANGAAGEQGGAAMLLANRFTNVSTAVATEDAGPTPENLPGCVVWPQYSNPVATDISLPAASTDVPFGAPSVCGAAGNSYAGMMVPAYTTAPTINIQSGTLAYYGGALHVYVQGAWKQVVTL